jgi:hypothetical protein
MQKDSPQYYRSKLKIDKHQLDEELIRQPVLFGKVATHAAYATSKRDSLYDNRKVVEGELQVRLRRKHEAEDVKFTEKSIEAEVLRHPERLKAVEDLNLADLELNEWVRLQKRRFCKAILRAEGLVWAAHQWLLPE